ncbi:hypothetical protein LQG66_17375 [Bradyrhizobium ontarionense]|uniref:Uncharacterized protein n=1 Tax=Bradyrhizobium ontarionense TaxID=2898149 RepID=A0ABY3RMD6_9BRAD|nr:hypothetical protein [Bradyrhizobium sp. A19]UFZ07958.1 hypothetical protein LQG66_17375 [Bradyrhizobium sp. A19]
MAATLDDLLPAMIKAGDAGLSLAKIRTTFGGKAAAKKVSPELREKLATLGREGAIWGPLKQGVAQLYFASGRGPSIETASRAIVTLVASSGVKLISKPGLDKKVTGMNKKFFSDGLKHAVASQAIVELTCGSSKYYLHRDVAADYFGFEATTSEPAPALLRPRDGEPVAASVLTLDDLLPAYRRLKAEQGGFSAVKIFDLMKASGETKEDLHRLLIDETKAGRVTIHPTTTIDLPAEEMDAGIRLAGFPEPFVTVVVKNEP